MHQAWRTFLDAMAALAGSEIPVVAAITGHCPAGGLVLALFCDRRVMARGDFQIGLNEVQVGIPLPGVIYKALERTVGPRRAEELAVPGALVDPDEALRLGLVDELADLDSVVDRAQAWCQGVLSLPPRAMSETRRLARRDLRALFHGIDEAAVDRMLEHCWYHPEAQATLSELVRRLGKE
jgi:enoyl-CoA hydratase/carnithine racemase